MYLMIGTSKKEILCDLLVKPLVDPVDIIKTHKHDEVAGPRVEGLGVGQAALDTVC